MNTTSCSVWCHALSLWQSSHSNFMHCSPMMQESTKQALSVLLEEKPLDTPAPATEAPAKPDQGLDLPTAPTELSDLLKAPEADTQPAQPAPTELSDLLKAPEAATESAPPSSAVTEGAVSPAPAPPVAPSPPASDSGSPLSVLVSPAAYAFRTEGWRERTWSRADRRWLIDEPSMTSLICMGLSWMWGGLHSDVRVSAG